MNTCKTSNPNWIYVGSDFDLSSFKAFYWDQIMNGFSDSSTYACDYADCDHEYCTVVDTFIITRLDVLLFPELEQSSVIRLWCTDQGFREYELIDSPYPMIQDALGL